MRKHLNLRANVALGLIFAFLLNSFGPVPLAQAQDFSLPAPGDRVYLSPDFTPAVLKGITIHPENPLMFDFIIYKGDKVLSIGQKQEEYKKLIKYFLASLAIPDEDQWVNLSPYEKDRIIKDDFGKTLMGRDLLAQDYILKQITASLIYPEKDLGRKFWEKVYAKAQAQYGTTNIPVNTFNKVWILPDEALVYEKGNTAYVLKSHLKVMLEEDYLSLQKHSGVIASAAKQSFKTHTIASQVVREIVLPALQKEVNEGKNFAVLRQVYSGMILAAWFKRTLRKSILGQIYADKTKLAGIVIPAGAGIHNAGIETIYQQYLRAYKKGVFNYIKEDADKYSDETMPRKYFSGGFVDAAQYVLKVTHKSAAGDHAMAEEASSDDSAQVALKNVNEVKTSRDAAMTVEQEIMLHIKAVMNLKNSVGLVDPIDELGPGHNLSFPIFNGRKDGPRPTEEDFEIAKGLLESFLSKNKEELKNLTGVTLKVISEMYPSVSRSYLTVTYDLPHASFFPGEFVGSLTASELRRAIEEKLKKASVFLHEEGSKKTDIEFLNMIVSRNDLVYDLDDSKVPHDPKDWAFNRKALERIFPDCPKLADRPLLKRGETIRKRFEAWFAHLTPAMISDVLPGDYVYTADSIRQVQGAFRQAVQWFEANHVFQGGDINAVFHLDTRTTYRYARRLERRQMDLMNLSRDGDSLYVAQINDGAMTAKRTIGDQENTKLYASASTRKEAVEAVEAEFRGLIAGLDGAVPSTRLITNKVSDQKYEAQLIVLPKSGYVRPTQNSAMIHPLNHTGGIDLNSANLAMMIKRDGKGVVLPLARQDLAELSNSIEGLDPVILSIRRAKETQVFLQL